MSKPTESNFRQESAGQVSDSGQGGRDNGRLPDLRDRLREIEKKELLYHAVFDQTFQLTATLDLDGNLLMVNRTSLRMIGAREEDVVGRPFGETAWWNHSPRGQEKLQRAIQEARAGRVSRFETRRIDADGHELVVDFSLKPALDQEGRVAFLIAEGRDITSYDQASKQLIQVKNLYLALSRVNAAILRNRGADRLLQEICEIAAAIDEVKLAWFGFAEPNRGRVRPLAWAGDALAAVHEFFVDSGQGGDFVEGPQTSHQAQESGAALVIDDLEQDPDAARWTAVLKSFGLRSLAAYPVQCLEGPSGIFVFYSNLPGLFRGAVGELFKEMAANVAHALDNLERERLRAETEKALRASEARYRELVENANTIILRLAPNGDVTYFNEFAEKFFGWSSAEVVGRPVWETLLPQGRHGGEDLGGLFAEVCSRPEEFRYHENQNICKDGRRVWVAWTNKVFRDSADGVVEVLSIGIDITEQRLQARLLERKAREEEVRARLLRLSVEELTLEEFLNRALQILVSAPWLEILPYGVVFLVEPSGRELRQVTSVNLPPEMERQCVSVPFGECVCGTAALEKRSLFGHRCRHGQPELEEFQAVHAHHVLPLMAGEEVLGVLSLYLPDDHRQDPTQENFLQSAADLLATVIARRQAQVVLREHDALLQQLIDSIPLPIFHKDRELVYQGCNLAFAKEVLGLPKQEIIGKTMHDIAPPDLADIYADADAKLLRDGGRQVYETEVKFTDGRRHPVVFHKAVLRAPDGSPRGIVGALLDLSEHKLLEEQLRHTQKVEALGTLTGGIAHDFNNLLTAIMGYASILQLKLPKHELYSDMVDQILATTERAAALTHSLLTYSRKKVANPQLIEINGVVQGIRKIAERVIRESISLDFDLSSQELVVLADASQLEQVLLNLVTNARDAMLKGGRLHIRTEKTEVDADRSRRHVGSLPGTYALLSVADTGTGIPEELLGRIFDPFFTTKEVGRGTGLGLSITYSIVKQHHGFIEVETDPCLGSTFRIYLPLSKESATAESPEVRVAYAPRGSETLLLVEDDPAVRIATRLMLEEFGYRVLEARDGEEALGRIEQRTGEIRLVISDVVMPGMDGIELRGEILRRWPRLPLLFTSGYTFDALEDYGADQAVEILEKPVKPAELLLRIRELLDRSGRT